MILECEAILSAVLTASSTRDSAGMTLDTRPYWEASWAVMGTPVRFISMALKILNNYQLQHTQYSDKITRLTLTKTELVAYQSQ